MPCHAMLDDLVLKHGISYREIAMEPGIEYQVGLRNLIPATFPGPLASVLPRKPATQHRVPSPEPITGRE